MEKNSLAVVITIAFSASGVLGDYFLKLASAHEHSLNQWDDLLTYPTESVVAMFALTLP